MEHEVFVPVPVPALRRTLGDPARVARCVPGLQQDADASAGPLAGRLKFRADGHTITYRGALTLRPSGGGGSFSVTGEGVEARGTGSAKLALTVGLTETDGGTTIGFTGTVSGDGRIVELDAGAALAAAQRLLDRFTQQLVTETLATRDDGAGESDAPSGESGETSAEGTSPEASPEAPSAEPPSSEPPSPEPPSVDKGSVFDAPVPPPSLDPSAEIEFTVPDEPPAEAAHARRTMIGRSTEEVDHAPPRGRYAPVPSPEAGAAGITLRWAAPAAALAIASAVVVGRALRRRRP
ncbi:SRPBCC domain-containing protein [Streptomyces sp. QL37]|uniref:SRPBCC domain-containing protein n=1 Tax=Streptomyces sp. QL37 TaxID=2093747 RepID=UPI000CF22E8A|nr:SRPBCC domain-containing protein [Streptomyces sp. QL37]PPQ58367.1 carbon monoxide dehydrogenase [Streptomyces sp. QL37]